VDCATLLKLYRSHVRSKLDYGCVVYGSARKSVFESLDRECGVEAGELPLVLRRQQLCLQYICKLRSNPCNPAFNGVFGTGFQRPFEARPNTTEQLVNFLGGSLRNFIGTRHDSQVYWQSVSVSF